MEPHDHRFTGRIRSCLLIIADSDVSFVSNSVCPEAITVQGATKSVSLWSIPYVKSLWFCLHRIHAVMRDKKPVSKDTLGQDIQDGVDDDLRINAHATGIRGSSPDTMNYVSIAIDTPGISRAYIG